MKRRTIKAHDFYYFLLVLFVIVLILNHYPKLYGKDAFEVMWMAQAIKNGALFSENSWLIHPASYFGYYPFSIRAIGIPFILSLILSFLNLISLGLTEAVLVFDIILVLIIYKVSRSLGESLFEEEWGRFLFTATILLSQYILDTIIMTVSTRIITTIVMIIFLDLSVKILNGSIKKIKAIFFGVIVFMCGILSHRLSLATIITLFLLIFTYLARKSKTVTRLTIYLVIPLCVIALLAGILIFQPLVFNFLSRLDPNDTFSQFINEESIFGIGISLAWFYIWNIGLNSIFFPIGVYSLIKQLFSLLKL